MYRYIFILFLLLSLGSNAQSDTSFVKLSSLDNRFGYDMRYATSNNFLKEKVYACSDCLLRKEVAMALVRANMFFLQKGYRIKLFDCYRPLDVQKKMWKIMPDSRYVADPAKGSIHNRGGAVDITLIDLNGRELDMGTDFDHFGEKAHHNFLDLPGNIIENRGLLKSGMEQAGFHALSTEWWHYNYKTSESYPVSNFKVQCTDQ